jgi:hypothetical protein
MDNAAMKMHPDSITEAKEGSLPHNSDIQQL